MNTLPSWMVALLAIGVAVPAMAQSDEKPGAPAPEHHKLALTPPMGWNSYDCFGYSVTEQQVKENADYMAANLKQHGWQYIVVDFIWSSPKLEPMFAPSQDDKFSPRLTMDENGRLLPEPNRFPSAANGVGFKSLADYVHGKGLKFGIHVMRGIPRQAVGANTPVLGCDGKAADAADVQSRCDWLNHMHGLNMKNPAAQAYLDSLFKLYASWDVDFVKVDDLGFPYHEAEVEGYRKAMDKCGRPMVFSTSPGPTPIESAAHITRNANMWRLLGDLWDDWGQLKIAFAATALWSKHFGPGHWPDLDMLPVGKLCKYGPNGPERYSKFSKEEVYTLLSLWLITRSPLMLGGNLPENDEFLNSLLTNDEALAVLNKSENNVQLFNADGLVCWVADVQGSKDKYLALFNTCDAIPEQKDVAGKEVKVTFKDLGLGDKCALRDLWQKKDAGKFENAYSVMIPWHGAALYRVTAQ